MRKVPLKIKCSVYERLFLQDNPFLSDKYKQNSKNPKSMSQHQSQWRLSLPDRLFKIFFKNS